MLHFYEKPGCINNTRQKQLLQAAGCEFQAHNLLAEPWSAERLQAFFQGLAVADWFNRSAPRVKSGEVVPESLDAEQALALMLTEPLLIRRPLMELNGKHLVGFDSDAVAATFALVLPDEVPDESCPRNDGHSCEP